MSFKFISKLLWHAPNYFNKWRIFPRLFILTYLWLLYTAAVWFMTMPNPTNAQSAFVSVIIGAGAAWFGLYVNSTGPKTKQPAMTPYDQALAELNATTAAPVPDQPQESMPVPTKVTTAITTEYKPRVFGSRNKVPTDSADQQPMG